MMLKLIGLGLLLSLPASQSTLSLRVTIVKSMKYYQYQELFQNPNPAAPIDLGAGLHYNQLAHHVEVSSYSYQLNLGGIFHPIFVVKLA